MLFCHIRSSRSAFRLMAAAGVLTLALALPSAHPAQNPSPRQAGERPRPMSLVDIAELPRVVDPQLSPDGKLVAYMLSQADWNAGRAIYHLWRQDTQGGAPVQLTTGTGETLGSTRWSPDGNAISFIRGGQLMLLTSAGDREPRPLSKHATNVSSPAWSPDGTSIYFLAPDAPTSADRERERRKDDIYALDENVRARQLWSVSVATGMEAAITSGPLSVLSYRLSGDGSL